MRPKPLDHDGEIVRLVAIRCATEARGHGLGWCCSCRGGGWDGPLPEHYRAVALALSRPLTPSEGEAFSRAFLAMVKLYPPEPCEAHAERASA